MNNQNSKIPAHLAEKLKGMIQTDPKSIPSSFEELIEETLRAGETLPPSITNPIIPKTLKSGDVVYLRQSVINEVGGLAATIFTLISTYKTLPVDYEGLKREVVNFQELCDAEEFDLKLKALVDSRLIWRLDKNYIMPSDDTQLYKDSRLEDIIEPKKRIRFKTIDPHFSSILKLIEKFIPVRQDYILLEREGNLTETHSPIIDILVNNGDDRVLFKFFPTESGLWEHTNYYALKRLYQAKDLKFFLDPPTDSRESHIHTLLGLLCYLTCSSE